MPWVATLDKLPSWVGSVPAWTTLIVVIGYILIQVVKNHPVVEQQKITERLNIKEGYVRRISDLEKAVKECQDECKKQQDESAKIIQTLQEKLNNEAMQRVQGEISLVSTLIQIMPDAEQLRRVMAALEARQIRMATQAETYLIEGEQ